MAKDPKPKSTRQRLRRIKQEGLRRAKGKESGQRKDDYSQDLDNITKGYASKVTSESDDLNNPTIDPRSNNTGGIRKKFREALGRIRQNDMSEEDIISGYNNSVSNQLGMKPQTKVMVMNKSNGQVEEHFIDPANDQPNPFSLMVADAFMGNGTFTFKNEQYEILPDNKVDNTTQKQMQELSTPPTQIPPVQEDMTTMADGGKMRKYKIYEQGGKLCKNDKVYQKYETLNTFQRADKFKMGGKIYQVTK